MLLFPNCKINLGLTITGKRADGFHDIETIFFPVQLRDALEIISLPDGDLLSEPVFTASGIHIDAAGKDNLCVKAWQLLKKDFSQLPSVAIHLHKAIPMGAGLGGGSADAAFTLIALNKEYTLNLSTEQLLLYALQLGSDCPFFIINKPCIAGGRGELLIPVTMNLSGYQLILVNPGIHINTGWAFSQLQNKPRSSAVPSLQEILSRPVTEWKDRLINDFETPVFQKYPGIKTVKKAMYEHGALFASMSGSGSTVYGLFDHEPHGFQFPESYLLHHILL